MVKSVSIIRLIDYDRLWSILKIKISKLKLLTIFLLITPSCHFIDNLLPSRYDSVSVPSFLIANNSFDNELI